MMRFLISIQVILIIFAVIPTGSGEFTAVTESGMGPAITIGDKNNCVTAHKDLVGVLFKIPCIDTLVYSVCTPDNIKAGKPKLKVNGADTASTLFIAVNIAPGYGENRYGMIQI